MFLSFFFKAKMLQLFNQLQSGLTGGGNSLGQQGFADDNYMDLEAQKKIAENIRYVPNFFVIGCY